MKKRVNQLRLLRPTIWAFSASHEGHLHETGDVPSLVLTVRQPKRMIKPARRRRLRGCLPIWAHILANPRMYQFKIIANATANRGLGKDNLWIWEG